MKNTKKNALALALTLTIFLSGCASSTTSAKLNTAKTLNIGINTDYFPIIIAEQKGFFKDEFKNDVTVKVQTFVNGPAQNAAVSSGAVDIGNMGDVPTIQEKANNVDIKVLSYLWSAPKGYSLIAGAKSGIKTLADIKGKKIALAYGSNMQKTYLKFLKKAGYSESDVQAVNISATAAQVAALTNGSVDAIIAGEPTLSKVKKSIGAVEILNTEGIDNVITVSFGRTQYLKTNPEIVARYFKVINRAIKWEDANPDEAVSIVAKVDGAKANTASLKSYFLSRTWQVKCDSSLISALDDTIDFAYTQKLIRQKLSAKDFVDDTYVKKAEALQ